MTISYEVGESMALIVKFGDALQGVVLGLNQMTMPGLERSIITVEEFRNAFSRQFAGGGNRGVLGYAGNAVLGDITGQDQLRAYLKSAEKFTDTRAYFNLNDFLACDIANDSVSGMQVTKAMFGQADKNSIIPYDGEIVMNGDYAIFTAHTLLADFADLAFAGSTITDASSKFVTQGFVAGQTIQVDGATTEANNGQKIIDTVAAGLITLTTAFDTDEAFIATTIAHGGVQ